MTGAIVERSADPAAAEGGSGDGIGSMTTENKFTQWVNTAKSSLEKRSHDGGHRGPADGRDHQERGALGRAAQKLRSVIGR
ncbi:hypothetical protein [Nocardia pseudobrasiliensis]|uniref:Uncharacterized protein n=1 Tax=Nocardia pseudobrasiliensis TaxID=45979 RepID=A0A370I893_9NOCA|nr:hypothetical protein [Nocardia pseudobrasiliensis]RDI66918.1 hypothetical protein DFR76_104671 [Nocardia pseudobrasiliensis]